MRATPPHPQRVFMQQRHDASLRTSLEEARRQAPRNVASILDSARELGIRDAQVTTT